MAVRQLTNKAPTENSKGLRFGNFVQGRTVIEEELEAAFAGRKTAKPRSTTRCARQRDPAAVRGGQQVNPQDAGGMEKRVVFRSAWLPYALVAPQIAITLVFFFWPAAQAVWYSFQLQDAFGLKTQFVGLQNFVTLFRDEHYLNSFRVTAVFSVSVAVLASPPRCCSR